MPIENLKKEVKATLYERIGSPFWGSFVLSWCLVNYELVGLLLFSDKKVEAKIDLTNLVLNDFNLSVYKPILLTLLFIIFHPLLSTLLFSWQEFIKSKKRTIKNIIEKKSLVPVEDYRKLESDSSERFSKYNSMIGAYEIKIDKLSSEIGILNKNNEHYEKEKGVYEETVSEIKNKEELISQLQQSCIDLEILLEDYKNINKKQKSENEAIDEGNRLLAKRIEHVENYFTLRGEFKHPQELKLDIPHLDLHSINRLVHEVKELGFYPVFDGDSQVIKISVPFYIDINLLEGLSNKYRADSTLSTDIKV